MFQSLIGNTALTCIIVIHVLGLLILTGEIVYVLTQQSSRQQLNVLFVIFNIAIWILAYSCELMAANVDMAMVAVRFEVIGQCIALINLYIFVRDFCQIKQPDWVLVVFAAIATIVLALAFTWDLHGLYYTSASFVPGHTFSNLIVEHGPAYWLFVLWIIATFVMDIVFCIMAFKRDWNKKEKRKRLSLILAIVITMLMGSVLTFFNVCRGYEASALGALISVILMGVLFIRHNFFDAIVMAKTRAMYNAPTAFIITDEYGELEYKNEMADKLIAISDKNISDFVDWALNNETISIGNHIYTVETAEIVSKGEYYGQAVSLRDSTDEFNYTEKLENEVAERTSEIKNVQRAAIIGLAQIFEARDGLTGKHIQNTSSYVELLAKELKEQGLFEEELTDSYIETITDVAPLHDVGKMAIPESILKKQAKLTPEEFDVIKTHSKIGADLIETNFRSMESDNYVDIAKDIALYHHERWDGSGYPNGLTEGEIPLSAQIMAIADTYDALVSIRVYKPRFSKEQAKAIMLEESGSHFNPVLVEAFFNALEKVQ